MRENSIQRKKGEKAAATCQGKHLEVLISGSTGSTYGEGRKGRTCTVW